jgi:hypothetical protein
MTRKAYPNPESRDARVNSGISNRLMTVIC